MTIYLNGKQIEVEENDEVRVEEAKPVEKVEVLEVKETLGRKIKNLSAWKKLTAATAAIAGGLWLKNQFSSDDDEDEDDEDEDENNDEE